MANRHQEHLSQYLRAHRTSQKQNTDGLYTADRRISTANNTENKEISERQSTKSAANRSVPVLFTSSNRASRASRAAFLAERRKPPVKITGPASINHLPDELLLEIFSHLDAGDLLMAAGVSHRWKTLANDSFLWGKIFKKYGGALGPQDARSADRHPLLHYKQQCIKQCSEMRNKRCMKLVKKISPFTGLPRDTDKALKLAGIYYQLCLVDKHKTEHMLYSCDVFVHQMAACIRWFDLEMPPIKNIRELRVYSINPLFYNKDGAALRNSPYQRSLLLSMEFDWNKWLRTTQPSGTDDMVNIYTLTDGVLVATWKGDGELAFICSGLHSNKLVRRCLHGTADRPYNLGVHKVVLDDIDSIYGLHDYRCTVEIRTLRLSIWSQQFNNLACKKENIGSGFATFPLIRKDHPVDHVILQKKLTLPWKTDAFKGIVEDVVWLDVTVLDERNEPFWCISSSARIKKQMLQENLNFDYTNQEVYTMTYMDGRGKLEGHMSQIANMHLVSVERFCIIHMIQIYTNTKFWRKVRRMVTDYCALLLGHPDCVKAVKVINRSSKGIYI